jgi:hypothetical protein
MLFWRYLLKLSAFYKYHKAKPLQKQVKNIKKYKVRSRKNGLLLFPCSPQGFNRFTVE